MTADSPIEQADKDNADANPGAGAGADTRTDGQRDEPPVKEVPDSRTGKDVPDTADEPSAPGDDDSDSPSSTPGPEVADLETVDREAFISPDDLWQRVEDMVDLGPRHTGNKAHADYVNYIDKWMQETGIVNIQRDEVKILGSNAMTTPGAPTSGTSEHIWGSLPGSGTKAIILGVHIDGQNSVEENGVPVVMAIAAYLAKIPKENRPYSYHIVFATGHMARIEGGSEAFSWSSLHRDVLKDVVAAVAPEHLGTMAGGMPVSFAVTASTSSVRSEMKSILDEMNIPAMTISSSGIGSGLIWRTGARLPVLAGISVPTYLFNTRKKMEVLDKKRLWDQAFFFLRGTLFMSTLQPEAFR